MQFQFPEGSVEYTFLVYDPHDGAIVHGHKALVLPFGDPPSVEELERQALEAAAQATGRGPSELGVIEVAADDLEPGMQYRMDIETRRLVRLSLEQSS